MATLHLFCCHHFNGFNQQKRPNLYQQGMPEPEHTKENAAATKYEWSFFDDVNVW